MNKVVCNLCGTSYPENAAQCPICGYARAAEVSSSASSEHGSYTYVKGGRFSKANVKKRNQAAGIASEKSSPKAKKQQRKSGAALVTVIIILLLAIVAVLGYIALRFFLPNSFFYEGLENLKLPSSQQQEEAAPEDPSGEPSVPADSEPETTEADLSCTAIKLDKTLLEFDAIGAEAVLKVTLEPADTPDQVSFTTADLNIAVVSDDGTVKTTGEGTTVITVSCGTVSTDCTVICSVPTAESSISLNRKEITFNVEGQSWLLYEGEILANEILWTSDDSTVATIENGKVVAVGNGDTTVYGTYNDQTVSCVIHCRLDGESTEEPGNISEAGSESARTYKLYNPTGYADDVTLNVGETFTLKLVDENKTEITGAQWNIENTNICSYENSTVKALASGTTKITATYEGVTYTCLIRVN